MTDAPSGRTPLRRGPLYHRLRSVYRVEDVTGCARRAGVRRHEYLAAMLGMGFRSLGRGSGVYERGRRDWRTE